MDEKKVDLWHATSRPPSSSDHISSIQFTHSSNTVHHLPTSQHHQHHPSNNMLYAHSDQHTSPRMGAAMPSRGLQEDVAPSNAALASHSFANALPLLDASDHVLPPILPSKRTYNQDDQTPSSHPVSTDWTSQHAPMPNKMRGMRNLSRTVTSPATGYGLPPAQPRGSLRDSSLQAPINTMPINTMPINTMSMRGAHIPGTPATDFNTSRMQQGGGYLKHEMYATGTADPSGMDPGNFRPGDMGMSRQMAYGDPLANLSTSAAPVPSFMTSNVASGSGMPAPPTHGSYLAGGGGAGSRSRRVSPCDDSFVIAAETGARAQCAVDNAAGEGVFETYDLGITIVQSSKLYANQRRSNRLLPGGSDSTTAACYMIGGTPDSVLSPLLSRVSPCDPREERCKAVERVLKDKTRGAICALNGENPREARADNLAAVRICEVVADILVAFSAKKLLENRKQLFQTVTRQELKIKELQAQLEEYKRESERWRKGGEEGGGGGGEERGVGSNGQTGVDGNDGRDGGEDQKPTKSVL